jgi:hypothetical protein
MIMTAGLRCLTMGFQVNKGGLLPPHPSFSHPRLYVDDFLAGVKPGGPAVIDYYSEVADHGGFPMDLNGPDPSNPPEIPDGIGCCGVAGPDHLQMALNAYAHSWGNEGIIKTYGAWGGYKLGDPSTDNGTNLQDNLNAWRKDGVPTVDGGTDKILFFGALRPGSWFRPERVKALQAFGGILYGHQWPESAEQQFPHALTYVPGSANAGGHCTVQLGELLGENEVRDCCWGRIVPASTGFLLHTVVEAWVVGTQDFIETSGRNPSGLDLDGINEALASLTSQLNPLNLRRIL